MLSAHNWDWSCEQIKRKNRDKWTWNLCETCKMSENNWYSGNGMESGILRKTTTTAASKPSSHQHSNHHQNHHHHLYGAHGPNPNENRFDDLLIFGYACKIFRDDDKARYIDQGKHLIPWMGDNTLKIDRLIHFLHHFLLVCTINWTKNQKKKLFYRKKKQKTKRCKSYTSQFNLIQNRTTNINCTEKKELRTNELSKQNGCIRWRQHQHNSKCKFSSKNEKHLKLIFSSGAEMESKKKSSRDTWGADCKTSESRTNWTDTLEMRDRGLRFTDPIDIRISLFRSPAAPHLSMCYVFCAQKKTNEKKEKLIKNKHQQK